MKCPGCGINSKPCPGLKCVCGYTFVFDLKTDGITDDRFLDIIQQAGRNETVHFLKDQLYSTYCKVLKAPPVMTIFWAFVFGCLMIAFLFDGHYLMSAVCCILTLILTCKALPVKISRDEFERQLKKWVQEKEPVNGLITSPSLHKPPPEWDEKDVNDYGVERILIVEHDILVDFYVLNDFHSYAKTLVVSYSGYPEYIMPQIKDALNQENTVSIFFLHDSGQVSRANTDKLKKTVFSAQLPETMTDLGVFSPDIKRIGPLKSVPFINEMSNVSVKLVPGAYLLDLTARAVESNSTISTVLQSLNHGVTDSYG